jgi:DNA-binding beta-propeller fold protein YncE
LDTATYPVYQDNFGFIHNRKINMTRLIAGDAYPTVLTLDELKPAVPAGAAPAPFGVDTSQMSLALGNLWITGGYPRDYGSPNEPVPATKRAQGMAVWVHQKAPDTTRPRVSYHIPQAGRTGYSRHAPLSFIVHEHPRRGGPRNGIDFTVRPVQADNTLGTSVPGYLIHDFAGVLTFTPTNSLAPDTTYQVDFVADNRNTADKNDDFGFQDAAGNLIEPYSFRFSTGSALNATPPPVLAELAATAYRPAPGATFTLTADATGSGPLEYRFNFDGTWTDWSTANQASHAYAETSRQRVLVQVKDSAGNIITDSVRLLVIPPVPAGPRPTQSSTLAIGDDRDGRRLWVVNPDAHTVSVLDASTGDRLAEYSTGAGSDPRSIARDINGRYWVTAHGSDQVLVFNPSGTLARTFTLPYGSAPFGVAPSPDGQSLFVTLYGSAKLLRYSAANLDTAPVSRDTFPTPRALAVSADGQRVLVTRFISPTYEGEVAEYAGASPTLTLTRTMKLAAAITKDGGDRAAGVPNYLSSIAISPDGTRAAVASKHDNTYRGPLYGVPDLTSESTVRAVVSFLDLAGNSRQVGGDDPKETTKPGTIGEMRHLRRDIDNSDSPSALAYSPAGDTLFIALQGNNRVVGLDLVNLSPVFGWAVLNSTETVPAVISSELRVGAAPQGLLLDDDTERLFTQNYLDRSVTLHDAVAFLEENLTVFPLVATTTTVAKEPLDAEILLGKKIFHNASDRRMSAEGYISCATCHADGGHDGRIWDFSGRGEGLRRTTDLRGRAGLGHGRLHWSGNFDEIQDFEHDIRAAFGGTGFLAGDPATFAALHPSSESRKAGLSPELDALAAYVTSLDPAKLPRSPHRKADGTLTDAAIRGRAVFTAQSCVDCHSGVHLTDSVLGPLSTPNLHDVGTLSSLSGLRLKQALEGIDTPTLHGLHATPTYLHHGLAATLPEVFNYAGGALHLASAAELIQEGSSTATIQTENRSEGGGGQTRGVLFGSLVRLSNTKVVETTPPPEPGVKFTGIDGGLAGGTARIALRYIRMHDNRTIRFRINGADTILPILAQDPPSNPWLSGWRWLDFEANLLPGAVNTIEIHRIKDEVYLNLLLVANADDLYAARHHRRVKTLPADQQSDLLAYLCTLDGRDDQGKPLPAPLTTANRITREVWANVGGKTIGDIPLSTPPTLVENLSSFESPHDKQERYGQRIRGHLTPTQSGDYTFWIASADQGELWLSTDDRVATRRLIASVSDWTPHRRWAWDPARKQRSAPVNLVAGRRYYIEALSKEDFGNDSLSVAWRLNNSTTPADDNGDHIIPGTVLSPWPGTITSTARFGFETSAQGWLRDTNIASVASSPEHPHTGERSLKIDVAKTSTGSGHANIRLPGTPDMVGRTVTFRVWLPETPAIRSLTAYSQTGAKWDWNAATVNQPVRGGWNTLSITLPANTTVGAIGVWLNIDGPFTGVFYLDEVNY